MGLDIALPIVVAALFFAATVVSGLQAWKRRTWFLWSLILSGLLISTGYAALAKWAASTDYKALDASARLNNLGSLFLAVAVYTTFGRLVWYITPPAHLTTRDLWFPPVWALPWMYAMLIIFVMLQCIWYFGVLAFIGLVLQFLLFAYFLVLNVRYRRVSRAWQPQEAETRPGRWRSLLDATTALAVLITLRSLLSFLSYIDALYFTYFQTYLFDALPMFLCFIIFHFIRPGSYLPADYTHLRLDKNQTTQTKLADLRVAQLVRETLGGRSERAASRTELPI